MVFISINGFVHICSTSKCNEYLLLNFWGCFSLIVWNRWAMEASCWHKTMIQMTQNLKINTSSGLYFWETYHANREVVVDDFIRHRIALLFILIGDDLHTPAVHQHLRAPLDVFKYTTQILAVISFNTQTPAWLTVHKYSMKHWENFCWRTSKKKSTHSNRASSFNCMETLQLSFVSHLLPIADIAQGHFLFPEEAPRQVAVPEDWLCLIARKRGMCVTMIFTRNWRVPFIDLDPPFSPIASRIQPTVPSPPHTRIL